MALNYCYSRIPDRNEIRDATCQYGQNGGENSIFRPSFNLSINGKIYQVDSTKIPADCSLNTFIRSHANLPGTKFMCLEGGCGACIVTATVHSQNHDTLRSFAINSCLTPVYACNGLEITTIEGIGNKEYGYHPVQMQLAKFNGTQCGYCSPGMVMNMYSLFQDYNGPVYMKDVEDSFGGNICRCTGYRPILDAFKSLTVDGYPKYAELCTDIEELPLNCGKRCGVSAKFMLFFEDGSEWHTPTDLNELCNILLELSKRPTYAYMLVAGNTSEGVYRRKKVPTSFIDIKLVKDLHTFSNNVGDNKVVIGGNNSLSDTMHILTRSSELEGFEYCKDLAEHIELIANVPVRNSGTIAGNLCIKHEHHEFPSDLYLILSAVGAAVTIVDSQKNIEIKSVESLLNYPIKYKIIVNIVLQPIDLKIYKFKTYKIMPRAQNSHAYVNAAFLLEFNKDTNLVKSASICFGGINPEFLHAVQTEDYLKEKDLYTEEVLQGAIAKLRSEINPDWLPPDAKPEYRENLALSLFYKFILATCPNEKLNPFLKSGGHILNRPISTGQQIYDTNLDRWPITQPIQKVEALVQCSGEAQYINDIPKMPEELWAAFVPATKVHMKIGEFNPKAALKMHGVHYFFTAKDIPGLNSFTPLSMMSIFEEEEIFCTDTAKYYGQPVGIILADSFDLANQAAAMVEIEYKFSCKVDPIIPTIFHAYENNALDRFHTKPAERKPKVEGKDVKYTAKGRFEMAGQYHFTLETQTTVCVPIEDGLNVYSATQYIDFVQVAISQCLKIPEASINMQVKRLGGAYGCKITRSSHIACACALAAKLTNRPVRFVMSLESNMATIGKRNGLITDYEVQVDEKGKIQKLVNDFAQDYGCSKNEDIISNTIEYIKNCYTTDTWKVSSKSVITDSASNSWCRAPGTTEGIAMIENIMEHIARVSGLDPIDVRQVNIPDDNKIKTLLPEFLKSVEYRKRKDKINQFNEKNRWTKRGIAITPMDYHQPFFGSIPVIVSIYHTDGTVAITHGGIECGQGINTKVIQVAAFTLGIPMEFIQIKPALNSVTPNSIATGGSMTSEAVSFATMKACEILIDRMAPVKNKMPVAEWQEITEACHQQLIDLSASYLYKETDVQQYTIWGLSCAEVEVDMLTGNFQLLRVDILEDTGESMSPQIDVGQVEGAFVMGMGYWLQENLVYSEKSGELLTNRTWNYKPPGAKDIPIDFRVTFLRNSSNKLSVLRSKATGEPALCMSVVCIFALRYALESARKDAGLNDVWFKMGAPTTPEHVFLASGTVPEKFTL